MNEHYDVAIVGGGIVGSTLACALARDGFNVALIEQHAPSLMVTTGDYDVRVSALTLASRRLLRNLGVWDLLETLAPGRVHPIARMEVWEQGPGLSFSAGDIDADCLGVIVENRLILAGLYERLTALKVRRYLPASVAAIDPTDTRTQIALADGRKLSATLLVGADGRDSSVRQLVGIAQQSRDYTQDAIVATVRLEQAHGGAAYQRFIASGPVALLPLDATRGSLVWSCEHTQAQALLPMDDTRFAQALTHALGERVGAIVGVGPRAAFPLRAAQAEHYVAPRIALIGDAAQHIHPLAGQGLNLGLTDAAALADVVTRARKRREDLGVLRVLRRYERWRKGHHGAMYATTDGLYRLFQQRAPGLRWARLSGMRLLNAATPLKRRMMRYAAGLHDDAPQLMRAPLPFE